MAPQLDVPKPCSPFTISTLLIAICVMYTSAVNDSPPMLTPNIIRWISSQTEAIVGEMESIIKQNVESAKFSVVGYLRYVALYDSLKLIVDKDIPELQWVARKLKAFSKTYSSILNVVADHLSDLDTRMSRIEAAEPKGKQNAVGKDWLYLYNTINYIATHSPQGSQLETTALDLLKKSPNGSKDRVRATRYKLGTHAYSR